MSLLYKGNALVKDAQDLDYCEDERTIKLIVELAFLIDRVEACQFFPGLVDFMLPEKKQPYCLSIFGKTYFDISINNMKIWKHHNYLSDELINNQHRSITVLINCLLELEVSDIDNFFNLIGGTPTAIAIHHHTDCLAEIYNNTELKEPNQGCDHA